MTEISRQVVHQYLGMALDELKKVPPDLRQVRQFIEEALAQTRACEAYEQKP